VLNALSAAALGFLLGLRHATDADHVVAITSIVSREGKFSRAARIGALWGVGHSLTVLVIGGALILYRVAIPPRLGLGLEFLVALVLIGLGFSNLRAKPASADEKAKHAHDGVRPFVVGVVHGLAGSAAVVLLVLAVIPDPTWAIAYLVVFGLGTIAGMTIVTWLIAAPAVFAAQRVQRFQRGIRLAAGSLSIVFGLVLAHAIVVNGGLFSATPGWTPR
jgi:cytochrome c biogenesis protein CcdA